jgi:hypothetical protein
MAERDANADADADADAVLRHRLFPRAMAWNVQRRSAAPSTDEQIVLAAARIIEQHQQQQSLASLEVARSFPLLQASASSREDAVRRPRAVTPPTVQRATSTVVGDERERLFRAVDKYLGSSVAPKATVTQSCVQQPPPYYQAPLAPIRRNYGGLPSPERMTAEQQAAFQAMKISSFEEEHERSWAAPSQAVGASGLKTPPLPPPGVHQIRLRSPPSATSGKKRTRGSAVHKPHSSAVGKNEIAPSLARALQTGCGAKQCSYEGCKKIAVSKGRCRGHGGGRRCQYSGCTKCAQSRSPFCWGHGGGKRCEAPNCRRSRKTKRFCVDHVAMEDTVPDSEAKSASTKAEAATTSTPSSAKTSTSSYASADSDDSVGKQSTASCDSSFSVLHNKENRRMPSGDYVVHEQTFVQYQQYAGEVSGVAAPPLQLPSLNEALLRTVPAQYASEAMWSSSRTPSPPAPHPSQYKSAFQAWPANSD